MNLTPNIEEGILELYVLDSLPSEEKLNVERVVKNHPQLLEKISEIEMTFESYSDLGTEAPRPTLRGRIIDNIVNLQKEQVMNINDLPIINSYSSYQNWLNLAKQLEMGAEVAGKSMHVLRNDEDVLQMVVTTTSGVQEENHPDVLESMLILEGECRFTIAGYLRIMKVGDFIDVPMNRVHNLELISPSLTVVLQKIKI